MSYSLTTPYPFRQFILKIHSRCDLACDYCYVYTMADQRWRTWPLTMSARTVELTANRIAEHAATHDLDSVEVVLHGGEPLLAGPDRIRHLVTAVRAALPGVATSIRMQTNAMLLHHDLVDLLAGLGVQVGVSVDGGQREHDRHRRRANGAGSYSTVRRALSMLAGRKGLFSGLLCTIDLRNDPVVTYRALLELEPPAVDFLLPHGNWSNPPPGRVPGSAETPYADWLVAVFEHWYQALGPEPRVRIFDEILTLLLGGQSRVEGLGLAPVSCVVVQTDGAIEQSDMLASAYEGAAATGLHVERNSFDEAAGTPGIAARQSGAAALAAACHECDLLRVCGGGLYWHRYRAGSGFRNPSVYCRDLYRLIAHCRDRVARDADRLRAVGA